jgi:hypothetical protein
MNIKSLLAGVALAVLSTSAFAATSLGQLPAPSTTSASNDDGTGFTFTTDANAQWVKITATDSNVSDSLATAFYTLVDTTTSTTIGTGTFTFVGALSQWVGLLPQTNINSADSFAFTFTGPAGTEANIGYSVTIGVPELSTWGMMLAGFGALAFAGYRRRAVAA